VPGFIICLASDHTFNAQQLMSICSLYRRVFQE
jgi:hypothetical protein